MSYKIKLGIINKYLESTARPDVTTWDEYDVVFKDGTDVVNPTLTLSIDYNTVSAYNYAYMLNRYYWITSKTMQRTGYCIITLETDVLATYKNEIGASDLYILRSSAAYDGYIPDNFYPPTANSTSEIQLQDADTIPTVNFNSGYYLLTVMGRGSSAGGAEFIYQLTPSQFKAVIKAVYDNIDGFQLEDVINGIGKAFGGNPQKLISGAVWVPYDFPAVSSSVIIGGYNTGVNGSIVTKNTIDLATFTYSIPKHPKAATKGKYLNTAPYSTYTMGINCGGIIELDSTKLVDVNEIIVYRTLDVKGMLQTWVQSTTAGHIYTHAVVYGQMGVPIALDGNSTTGATVSAITGAIGGIVAAAATGGTATIAGATVAGIGSITSAISGASSNVASGSIAGIGMHGRLMSTFYDIPGEDNTRNGRPYCKIAKPQNLGGYMIASRGDVNISGTLPEEQQIKTFLESGFFFE